MTTTRTGIDFDAILELAEAKPEGGIWQLAPDEVEELQSIGLTVRELGGERGICRRCQVTK